MAPFPKFHLPASASSNHVVKLEAVNVISILPYRGMPALGQKRTSEHDWFISALPQKRTLRRGMIAYAWDVRALDQADFLVSRQVRVACASANDEVVLVASNTSDEARTNSSAKGCMSAAPAAQR